MDRNDASALADLQMHWDEAYVIGLDGDVWSARYRNSADELRAHTSTELRELIRSDYAYRQKADLAPRDADDDAEADLDDIDDIDDLDDLDDIDDLDDLDHEDDEPGLDEGDQAAVTVDCAGPGVVGDKFAAVRGERMST